MFRVGVIFIFIIVNLSTSLAQRVEVNGRFYADSLKIGEPVPYSLTARYPKELNLVFPDSTFAFAPFEFFRKEFYPTITKNNVSYDSVVYHLTSYEIDSTQYTRLPVFIIHPGDCTTIYSKYDTIFLKHLVVAVPDSVAAPQLPLKTQTSYLNVRWLLNYPLLLIGAGVLAVILIFVWIVFGKRIRKYFRMKKLQRQHREFLEQYNQALHQMAGSYSVTKAEKILLIWKQYMEQLETKPFTKYTSKEILLTEKDDHLGRMLNVIDRMIYGNRPEEVKSFSDLKDYTQTKFNQKLETLRHG